MPAPIAYQIGQQDNMFSENGNRKPLFKGISALAFKFIFKITASGIHPTLIKDLLLLKTVTL